MEFVCCRCEAVLWERVDRSNDRYVVVEVRRHLIYTDTYNGELRERPLCLQCYYTDKRGP